MAEDMTRNEAHEAEQAAQQPPIENEQPPDAASPADTAQKPPKKGKEKKKSELEQLQSDYAALNDRYTRLLAEYDNFRKRSAREHDAIYPEATAAAATAFLAVADNFERAIAAPCSDESYKKGTEMTYQSLLDALAGLQVEGFGAVGEPFDPNLHNAVMHIEDDTLAPQSLAEVFQRGYRLGDRVLRHAMVKVAN